MLRRDFLTLLGCGALAAQATNSSAANPPAPAKPVTTTIYVDDMHCGACAKKIARKLYAVPGVVKVQTNLQNHTAIITPQADKPPAAKSLWAAVEQAGFQPLKLVGPGGTMVPKPGAAKIARQPHHDDAG